MQFYRNSTLLKNKEEKLLAFSIVKRLNFKIRMAKSVVLNLCAMKLFKKHLSIGPSSFFLLDTTF